MHLSAALTTGMTCASDLAKVPSRTITDFTGTGRHDTTEILMADHKSLFKQSTIFVVRQAICVFAHSVMTNFNCACPDIQRGQ